jgi:hypothetical protein
MSHSVIVEIRTGREAFAAGIALYIRLEDIEKRDKGDPLILMVRSKSAFSARLKCENECLTMRLFSAMDASVSVERA